MKSLQAYLFLTIILLFASNTPVFSQSQGVLKYKAIGLATAPVVEGKIKTPFTEEKEISVLVVINLNKGKIDIYSPKEQHFDIISYEPADSSNPSFVNYEFTCVDQDGDKCSVFLIMPKDNTYEQMWIRYSSIVFSYKLKIN